MRPHYEPIEDRVLDKFEAGDGCWRWKAASNHLGYGQIRSAQASGVRASIRMAHRVVYEMIRGPIPDGLELDHLCRNTSCVRPSHLEPVTHQENISRGDTRTNNALAARDVCKSGHPFDEKNTHMAIGPSGPYRSCRSCKRIREQVRRDRQHIDRPAK